MMQKLTKTSRVELRPFSPSSEVPTSMVGGNLGFAKFAYDRVCGLLISGSPCGLSLPLPNPMGLRPPEW